jgi:hypothetical protein
MELTGESSLHDVIARYPSTGDIFIQHGRIFRVKPGNPYATYDPSLSIAEYASQNGLALAPLLAQLRAAAEDDVARREMTTPTPPRVAAPLETIGYTGAFRERGGDAPEHVPIASVLHARGPD